VLVTKYRNPVIDKLILERLHAIFQEQLQKWDVELIEFNGESDHVHLLIKTHPSLDLSKLINSIKTVSSRLIRKEFKERVDSYYLKPYFWSRAYCLLTTGGATIDVIKRYIENQDKPVK
jgi:putative transposase